MQESMSNGIISKTVWINPGAQEAFKGSLILFSELKDTNTTDDEAVVVGPSYSRGTMMAGTQAGTFGIIIE